MKLSIESRAMLRNGIEIPRLGLGVFRASSGVETRDAILWALELGYRHIDTAHVYHNEADVGQALRESGLPRDRVFVTTKLWNSDHGQENALVALEKSLELMQLDYVDLYLLHWPVPDLRNETWEALQKPLEEGKIRALGVSNFMVHHLQELLAYSQAVPVVNQVELSPFLQQRELRQFCEKKGIQLEAYSPLTKGMRLKHRELVDIGRQYNKSPAQILIRWSLQLGHVVLPKSVQQKRIAENADVFSFELSTNDMARLEKLEENLHTGWDPTSVP